MILSLKITVHLKCVATLPCEMSSVLKVTTENNTTSVTIHFNKVTTENSVFIVSVFVYHDIMQFLHQMFIVSALLLDDALKPATPLTNGAISETLRQFATVTTHLSCDGIFSDSIITNFLLILIVK